MSGTNDYQLYAGSSGANVITQAQYLALTSIIDNGMSSGIVPSNQMNKILRQLSMASAALGQIIANNNVNAVDDGNVANFVSQLLAALNVELGIPTVPSFATNTEAQTGTSTTKIINPANLAATMIGGGNQSWQNVTATRASGTTYTNSTGRPIEVIINSLSNNACRLYINGNLIAHACYSGSSNTPNSLSAIIPHNSTYSTPDSFSAWNELR